jgi:hypothetical protein
MVGLKINDVSGNENRPPSLETLTRRIQAGGIIYSTHGSSKSLARREKPTPWLRKGVGQAQEPALVDGNSGPRISDVQLL